MEAYKKKRDFKKTNEPSGAVKSTRGNTGKNTYVIQKHQASHLHWDLRLEMGGVLKSWAVPKEPPKTKGLKRLAVQTEDHPVDYAKFHGTIPEGQYGAGTVEIWDSGSFEIEEKKPDELMIDINGKKLKGPYALIRFKKAGPKSWLFFKR